MATSFYFYDLETSGVNPRTARIMQFAGQRVDEQLGPIGEPHNLLIKLTEDVLPEPDAILITGITPQQTHADGLTEAEFMRIFENEIALPDTIFVGFNSVRFDDEFMRFMHYRNFYDAYEWQWKDGRSRWDLLDVVRMTRALRPEGIKWPVDSKGKPTNRLELLTSLNGLDHANAHDALSDVQATIDLARLLKSKQPKLFEYLLKLRDKNQVAQLVGAGQPFVYSSGKYSSEHEKTTVAIKLCDHPKKQGALVYDLRHDPSEFVSLSPEKLAALWTKKWNEPGPRLPVKTLQFNRCPAVAPLSVLEVADTTKRLELDMDQVARHATVLAAQPSFAQNIVKAVDILDTKQQASFLAQSQEVDGRLYDGFIGNEDKRAMQFVRESQAAKAVDLQDSRLQALLPLYKARNYPKSLSDDERQTWEEFIQTRLSSGKPSRLEKYFARLTELSQQTRLTKNQQYLLEELRLYGESLLGDF